MIDPRKFFNAVKIQFVKPIFEDDFVEKGMTAWLTDIVWHSKSEMWELFFDFTDFEAENEKYFKRTFYGPNPNDPKRYTAKEMGLYEPKYSVFFSFDGCKKLTEFSDFHDLKRFDDERKKYFLMVE